METDFRDSGYVPVIYFYRLPYLSLSNGYRDRECTRVFRLFLGLSKNIRRFVKMIEWALFMRRVLLLSEIQIKTHYAHFYPPSC